MNNHMMFEGTILSITDSHGNITKIGEPVNFQGLADEGYFTGTWHISDHEIRQFRIFIDEYCKHYSNKLWC